MLQQLKSLKYIDKNLLTILALCVGVFTVLLATLFSLWFLLVPLIVALTVFAFYSPTKMIYIAFFIMSVNGLLRWSTGQPQLIALFLDLIVLCLYTKFAFDLIVQKKLNILKEIPLATPILFFMLYGFMHIFHPNTSLAQGVFGFRIMIFYVGLYFIGYYHFTSWGKLTNFFKYLLTLLLMVALYGIKQNVFGPTPVELAWIEQVRATSFVEGSQKIFSLLPSSQDLATLLVLYIPLFFPLGFLIEKRKYRYLYGFALLLFFVVLTFTLIRGAVLAAILAVGLQCLYLLRQRIIGRQYIYRWLAVLFMTIAVTVVSLSVVQFSTEQAYDSNLAQLTLRMRSMGALLSVTGVVQQSTNMQNQLFSFYERQSIWHNKLNEAGITFIGQGIGSQKVVSATATQNIVIDNGILRIYLELGLIGLFLYLFILLSFYLKAGGAINQKAVPGSLHYRVVIMQTTAVGLITSFLLLNLSGEYYELTPAKLSFWLFLGIYSSFQTKQTLVEVTAND